MNIQWPEATLALKQGVGRLIRTERDRGLLVIADGRLLRRSYGPSLLGGLPPMRWLPPPPVRPCPRSRRRCRLAWRRPSSAPAYCR